jgi:hypothetical protein
MKEVTGDIWQLALGKVIGITTCGVIKNDGCLTMGKGIAKQAADKYPFLPYKLGRLVADWGNNPFLLYTVDYWVLTYPTKYHWREQSDLGLIKKSAMEILRIANKFKLKEIFLPRLGCGNGGLDWKDVKAVVEPILDDRFIVVSLGEK